MRGIRRSIFIITLVLLATGVVMVYSSSALYGYERLSDSMHFIKRHLMYLCIGFVMMFASMTVKLDVMKKMSKPVMFVSLMMLSVVLIPGIGREFGGAKRWIHFGMINFQPSEFAKVAVIIYLAGFLSRKGKDIRDLVYGYAPGAIVIGITVGLICVEPDLGTAIVVAAIGLTMMFVAGANIRHLAVTTLAAAPVLLIQLIGVPYRRRRLAIFLNPWSDSRGSGFQIIQSLLALSSGGLFGLGLGHSRQKLFYLPEPYSDFIFSIIGEELGFIGAGSIVMLFALFCWQGMRIVLKTDDPFGRFVSLGIIAMISFEVIINIGVVSGIFPTKGLPLPFISYGGTSLIFHMTAVGILLNVAAANDEGRS
ncbi:MAG: putative lipid II flippase FtsW [Candidatus Omnitrophota bacterium]